MAEKVAKEEEMQRQKDEAHAAEKELKTISDKDKKTIT
jgi:hypothetical protein